MLELVFPRFSCIIQTNISESNLEIVTEYDYLIGNGQVETA
jgi:hypothetical protein